MQLCNKDTIENKKKQSAIKVPNEQSSTCTPLLESPTLKHQNMRPKDILKNEPTALQEYSKES